MDMGYNNKFLGLKETGELVRIMIESKKDILYSLVYLLLTLALILLVAITTVKMTFFSMNFVDNYLRNQIVDQWLNDSLVVYIEKKNCSLNNKVILQHF